MSRKEVREKYDEIVEFSGVERYIDTPIKFYSSGMKVRLAFAVAAHLEPEILIIDEVLAVGDASFQRKCLDKMGEFGSGDRTVLFVSHNMAAITSLCDRTYWIDDGRIVSSGPSDQIVSEYLDSMSDYSELEEVPLDKRTDRSGSEVFKFTSISIVDSSGEPVQRVMVGQDIQIRLGYLARSGEDLRNIMVTLSVWKNSNEGVTLLSTEITGDDFETIPSQGEIVCNIPNVPILPGVYKLIVWGGSNRIVADLVRDVTRLEVVSGDYYGTGKLPRPRFGDIVIPHSWGLIGPDGSAVGESLKEDVLARERHEITGN